MATGKLTKLTIQAYKSSKFEEPIADSKFTTLINPESISIQKKVEYTKTQADGTASTDPKFNRIISPDLDLQILFDGTGALVNNSTADTNISAFKLSVKEQIELFEKVIIQYDGTNHKPNHVWVRWGALSFRGVLMDLSYEYKLFTSEGAPLRVVAKLKLSDAVEENLRAAKQKNESPDLTHSRQVVEGDTLPRMCFKIYGDSKYYLEVAKANNITNFRKLIPGQRISFPPIEKISQ